MHGRIDTTPRSLVSQASKRLMCLAVPGQVESVFDHNALPMGKVNFGGVVKEVCLAYLPDIQIGDYVLVHVGFAISQVDEVSAMETLKTFEELGLLDEELSELRQTEFEDSKDSAPMVDPLAE